MKKLEVYLISFPFQPLVYLLGLHVRQSLPCLLGVQQVPDN